MTAPRLYSLWRSIRYRCERKRDRAYAQYGAQGVRVCDAWQDFATFQAWAKKTRGEPGQALLLRDPKRGYCPSNCSWGTKQEAARTGLTAFGETKSISEWARGRRAVVNAQTIRDRVRHGVSPEDAISAKQVTYGKASKSRRYRRIDWKRVQKLRDLPATEIARRLGNAPTAILRGLKDRGWLERPIPIRELKHGEQLYNVWDNMRQRQGAPGWPTFVAFHAWALKSGYAPGLHLTRPNRAKAAGPRNAVWLPVSESLTFRRPLTASHKPMRLIRAFGERKGATEWANDPRCVVTVTGLLARLDRGMKPQDAITKRKRREADYNSSKEVTAWGVEKPVAAWARDRRAKVGEHSIRQRLKAGWMPEAAISTAAFARPK